MLPVSRRSFLASAAALPFLTWLEKVAPTLELQKLVRYDATSSQGQAMLATYANAVAAMKTLSPSDPRSWTFQWYIHSLPGDKTTEINRVFGSGSSPQKTLAQASWKTCQPHNAPGVENYFLPWHRAYVLYFESIVRQISGVAGFTLPYWNYTVTGPQHGVIPPQFRNNTSSSLYVANRISDVNKGVPIDHGLNPTPINLDSLQYCNYDTFNYQLDRGLHGNVHGLTGTGTNMGSVPYAAGDPVFWAHHCQIDRIWYSWQRAGRVTPPLSSNFTFVNANGTSVTVNLSQFLSYTAQPYVYDSYVAVPSCTTNKRLVAQQEEVLAARRQAQPIPLGPGPVEVTLSPRVTTQPLSARVRALPGDHHVFLVVRDVSTNVAPNGLYEVFIQLPQNASAATRAQYHVGYINFFEASNAEGAHHGGDFRFDITNLVRRLGNSLASSVRVTIQPAGNAALGQARPVIGDIVMTHL
jgi:tyrosinase